jgi:hypothetical protein
MITVSMFKIDVKGNATIQFNGETYKSRFYSVNPERLKQLTIQNIEEIAYDLVNDFYNPNIPERALSIGGSDILKRRVIEHIVTYLLG